MDQKNSPANPKPIWPLTAYLLERHEADGYDRDQTVTYTEVGELLPPLRGRESFSLLLTRDISAYSEIVCEYPQDVADAIRTGRMEPPLD